MQQCKNAGNKSRESAFFAGFERRPLGGDTCIMKPSNRGVCQARGRRGRGPGRKQSTERSATTAMINYHLMNMHEARSRLRVRNTKLPSTTCCLLGFCDVFQLFSPRFFQRIFILIFAEHTFWQTFKHFNYVKSKSRLLQFRFLYC